MPENLRPVCKDDFKASRVIEAYCVKGNQYLEQGKLYKIRYMEKRNKVSVPLCDNPQLVHSNSGAEFSLSRFAVKKEVTI